ncbi:hypothetical protein ACU19_07595 [Actinobaculum suis]|nr:hypothetical protein ACU19_07595 [Actinobaculum suis]
MSFVRSGPPRASARRTAGAPGERPASGSSCARLRMGPAARQIASAASSSGCASKPSRPPATKPSATSQGPLAICQ